MVNHHYKLHYFKGRARGEFIRYMFLYTKTKFEEREIDYMTEWQAIKPSMPTGQVPVLEVDGKYEIGTTIAIGTYLGKKLGLNAKTDEDDALGIMIVDYVQDAIMKFMDCFKAKMMHDDELLAKAWPTVRESVAVPMFDKAEDWLKTHNNPATGYYVGNSLTWYDLYMATWLPQLARTFDPTLLDTHPAIKKHVEMVEALPGIKERVHSEIKYPITF